MTYSNATFFVDLEAGNDAARTALTAVAVSNNGAGAVRCTKAAHGLVTGAVGTATLNYAGDWKIAVVDVNNFDLVGSVYATATALTFTPFGGSSKADAWKTLGSGATAARIAPGDIIKLKASPDETLVGDVAWTQYSKDLTLPVAVTANISTCETAWTASANVTATAPTSFPKEGTKHAALAIAAGFTTGIVAYFPTGALDLSSYNQVSFWIRNNTGIGAGVLTLNLCTDAVGAVPAHTLAIPALPSFDRWTALTIDTGGAMNAGINSISLVALTDPGTVSVYLDNIIACQAPGAATSLSLTSLIGKVWNRVWQASTGYSVNDIRKPTQPNRNGFCYRVSAQVAASGLVEPDWPLEHGASVDDGGVTWVCYDLEESWFPIKSINGTAVKIDNDTNSIVTNGRGYHGVTETVATFKREPIPVTMATNGNSSVNVVNDNGSPSALIVITGGWDRTTMAVQDGETWVDGRNGSGAGISFSGSATWIKVRNFNTTRFNLGIYRSTAPSLYFENCHNVGNGGGFNGQSTHVRGTITGCQFNNSASEGIANSGGNLLLRLLRVTANNNQQNGIICIAFSGSIFACDANYVNAKNNLLYGISSVAGDQLVFRNVVTGGNGTAAVEGNTEVNFVNSVFPEALFATGSSVSVGVRDAFIYSHNHNRVDGAHLITSPSVAKIESDTVTRHTAAGISWKFSILDFTKRNNACPMELVVAHRLCAAGVPVIVTIWTRRDSLLIEGSLIIRGGQIAGVPADVSVSCAPAINTWLQSANLTFTPTIDGVVQIVFCVWSDASNTANFWIDDVAFS